MRARMIPFVPVIVAVVIGGSAPHAQAPPQPEVRSRVYATGFTSPIAFVQDPTDPAVQFVVEQGGRIRAVRSGTVLSPDFLDLTTSIRSGGEQGLLGMAIAPDYATSGRFFVNFTDTQGRTVVARFRRSPNGIVADPSTRFDLRLGPGGQPFIEQPFANHNGGHLAFGPDGYLYIGLGDGGSGNDPLHAAQTPGTVLGKMLRIDVNVPDGHAAGYTVPTGNPFAAAAGTRPEIWSFGLRNPWRYSFDSTTGAMLLGDVGQNGWEEINYEPPGRGGRNYGWRNREGAHDNVLSLPPAYGPLTDPIHEYDHSLGRSVTGGDVYRGALLGAAYNGRYFFGDFIRSRVWSIGLTVDPATGEATASARVEHTDELGGASELANVASFGVDAERELYIVSYGRGLILKIISATAVPATPTGLRIIR